MGVLKFDTKKCSSCYQRPVLSHELFKSDRTPIRFHSKFVVLLLIVICAVFSLLNVGHAHAAGNVATLTVWNTIGAYAVSQCNTPVTYNPTYSAVGLCVENVYMSHNCSGTATNCISNWVITSITPTSATECYTINSMQECIIALATQAVCPSNSSGSPCTCKTGFEPDATGQSCIAVPVATCPIPPLVDLPSDDACAQSLDAGLGKDVNGKCPPLDDWLNGTDGQLQCFADKMAALNVTAKPTIPYSGPTATIRDAAYQAHLQNVWDKMIELNSLSDPVQISACQSLREKVIAEKGCDSSGSCDDVCTAGSHCLDYRPPDSTNHSAGTAFDVSRSTITGLLSELTPLPPAPMTALQKLQAQRIWIADWLANPTACNLFWGGNWQNPDYIHFQLP